MKKSTKRKLFKLFFGELIEFKLVLPNWLIIITFFMPFIAYADLCMFGKRTFWGYLGISFFELLLVYIGFTIANTKFKLYKKKKCP